MSLFGQNFFVAVSQKVCHVIYGPLFHKEGFSAHFHLPNPLVVIVRNYCLVFRGH